MIMNNLINQIAISLKTLSNDMNLFAFINLLSQLALFLATLYFALGRAIS